MKAGLIRYKIPESNIFVVEVGCGQLRYFTSCENYKDNDVILYEEESFFDYIEREKTESDSDSKDASLKAEAFDTNKIKVICRFQDCEYLGNVRYDFARPVFKKDIITIARRGNFVYWTVLQGEKYKDYDRVQYFDKISNSLLFLRYAEAKFKFPKENDLLNAYIYAKKKVKELDIPKIIDELKVEVHHNDWTRRGSDNVLFCSSKIHYNYEYNYSYLHDEYLDAIFPKYEVPLYSSKDDDIEYINPKYEKMEIIRMPDDSIKIKKEKFEGMDIDEFCAQKTVEMRKIALKNYASYNLDEHINYIAYHHVDWYSFREEEQLLLKQKGLADNIWGFKHKRLIKKITKDNYKELVKKNNSCHPIPQFPDDEDEFEEFEEIFENLDSSNNSYKF